MTGENKPNKETKAGKGKASPQTAEEFEAELREMAIKETVDERATRKEYHRQLDEVWDKAKKLGLSEDTQGEIYDALHGSNLQAAILIMNNAVEKAYAEGKLNYKEYIEAKGTSNN